MKAIQGIFFRDFRNAYIPSILQELYTDKVYDPFLDGKKDLTIMDLGANIGLFTFYAYDKAKIIYSVEPSKDHYEELVTMCAFNEFHKVVPINQAVGHEAGIQKFHLSQNSTMYSLSDNLGHMDNGQTEDVVVSTMDQIFKDNNIEHIDFMKMDIEGEEDKLIASKGFEAVASKIDTIVGETHTWNGTNPDQIMTNLHDLGFKTTWLNKNKVSLFAATRL